MNHWIYKERYLNKFSMTLGKISAIGVIQVESVMYTWIAHNLETPEKEIQDTSCRGSGVSPSFKKSPKIGGYRGLTETISAVSYRLKE